jgi:hypothetical protein
MGELTLAARNLAEPDNGLDSLELTEEWPLVLEVVVSLVLQQALCSGRNRPVRGIAKAPPGFNIGAYLVYDHAGIVSGVARSVFEKKFRLAYLW